MAESTRRRDAATASTGAVLLGAGGALRHGGVHAGFPTKKPKIHALGMLRAPHGKRLFWSGSAIGAIGLPPLAVGATHLVQGSKVNKADDSKRGFWREGLSGTREALGERAQSYKEPVPTKLRAAQLGVGAGVGALGSLAARAALGRRGNALKPLLTPVAGGLAATASVPVSNKVVQRHHPEYQITAAGVRRRKTDPKKPSSKASTYRPMPRSLRQDMAKSAHDDAMSRTYQGSRTPYFKQRAAITAAGHPPVIGPFTQAATAARYAPPGQGRKEALRQYGMASAAGIPAGAAGAYAGAHLAQHSYLAEGVANDVMSVKHAVHGAARRAVGVSDKAGKGPGRLTRRFLASGAGKPFRTKAGAAGGAAGFLGAKMASGAVLGQTAITMNQNDQRRYNKTHHINKSMPVPQTHRERSDLARKKRRSAALSAIGGTAGLGSLGLLAARKKEPAILLGTIGSGIGGANALLGSQVQRQEAKAVDPVKKGFKQKPQLWEVRSHRPKNHLIEGPTYWDKKAKHGKPIYQFQGARLYRTQKHDVDKAVGRHVLLAKATALAIEGDKRQHAEMIRRYGDRGPLPKNLPREERMKAYEARYVHHGGEKQNKWSQRATTGERLKNAGLGVATAGGAAWLATRGKRGVGLMAKHPRLQHHAETAAVAGATVGGAGEMLAGYAHRKQSSYANSPGGVAASALRRMRAYTPEEQQ